MRLEFDQSELRKLVETVASALVPKIVEQIKQPDREIWTHRDLSRALGVTPQTLNAYRESGKLVGSQPGRGWIYSRENVLRFLTDTQMD